ncbi:MAG: acyl-CoA synthetase (AMP-forming)/AMP-acid ligase II [Bacteroidia bacterium]|jgi:acyl-CoA synthetase (AMP-forming)/AMP-acid ligase II
MLVHHFLEYYARNTPDAPCVTQEDVTHTYGDVNERSIRLAAAMLHSGVQKGERVAILGENSVEHMLVMIAASRIGAVSVPLNYRLAPAELAFIITDAGVRVLLILDDLADTLAALREQIPDDIALVTQSLPDTLHLQDYLGTGSADLPELDLGRHDPVIQLYTSGTTGNPKGVVSSHDNLITLQIMNSLAMPLRPSPGTAGIICAPLFHIGGAGSVIMGLYSGQHTILHKAFEPNQLLDDIERYPVTGVFMVPAMIMFVLQIPGIEQRDFSQLEQIYYGASPISETVLRQALEVFKCDFIQMYGMTETTGTVVNLSPEDHRKALAGRPELLRSCGRPSVGGAAKVVGGDGIELEAGEVGEIWLKSDTNMLGYHNLPEATAENLTDGWVHTGDAGYVDEEGYLYLKDRIKDMVVSGGENIYPVEVENAIAKHDAVADVAVIGVPDDKYGEALLAFIVTTPDGSISAQELVEFCRDKIAGYKIPRQMELIDELPRNPSGKILKKILREPYWDGGSRSIG